MALIHDAPLTKDFSGVFNLQSNGIVDSAASYPNGLADHIEIGDWGGNIGQACRMTIYESDEGTPKNFAGHRTEMSFPQIPKGHYWFAYEVYVPGYDECPSVFAPTTCQVLTDFTDIAIADDPCMGGYVYDDTYIPKYHADYIQHSTLHVNYNCAPMPRGRWVRVVHHGLWANTNGFMELAVDGKFLFRHWNIPTVHADAGLIYMKVGCYNINRIAGYGMARMYFRNVKVGDQNETWQSMNGGEPLAPWSPFVID